MLTLKDILAIEDLNKRHIAMQQWGQDRGFNHSYPGLIVMRYIEGLEEALQSLHDDCLASDFNEHWESYQRASTALKA